jgi:hypothetical protein
MHIFYTFGIYLALMFVTMTISLCLIMVPSGLVRLVSSFQTNVWCFYNLILKRDPSSRVQTRPKPSDFSGEKILSTPSFRRVVKPSVLCRALRHVKELKSDVEVATFGKILGHFLTIVPPSATGFASVASDAGGLLWRKLEHSKSLVLLQVGGLTSRW